MRRRRDPAVPARPGELSATSGRMAVGLGLAAIALGGAALASIAFRFHPVGDYFTESDFSAGYVLGARALAHGVFDPARYGVYGPGYELVLAAVGAVVPDLFTAARVVSVLSAVLVLASSWAWMRQRFGAPAAAWLVALVAINPTFVRYGYSAGTDMLSFAFFAVGLAWVLGSRDLRGAAGAGLAAGLATLTRYNLASLIPGALIVWLARRPWSHAVRGVALLVAVFALTVLPLVIAGVRSGHPPGAMLLHDAGFYLGDTPSRMLEDRYAATTERDRTSPLALAPLAARLAGRMGSGALAHARGDAGILLGWPAAALAIAGAVWCIGRGRTRPLFAVLALIATTFLSLAPVYFSERYSMVLLPLYLAPAAAALGSMCARGGARAIVAIALGAVVLVATGRECVSLQQLVYLSLPTESLEAGRAIAAEAVPGDRVVARKAHVAFAADLEPVLLPDVGTLAELAAFCRREHVHYLYYSWYEARLRPQFGYLLDTSATVSGLVAIHATVDKPSATYRVTEGFGSEPVWWSDSTRREAIKQRVNKLLAPALAASYGRRAGDAPETDR